MKKLLALILALVCIAGTSLAEFDLASMSYDELVSLRKAIEKEMVTRPEWKEVKVPAGDWKVGEDIPAGTYSVESTGVTGFVVWRKAVDDYSNNGMVMAVTLQKGEPIGKLVLEEGFIVSMTYDSVIFAPPMTLGF